MKNYYKIIKTSNPFTNVLEEFYRLLINQNNPYIKASKVSLPSKLFSDLKNVKKLLKYIQKYFINVFENKRLLIEIVSLAVTLLYLYFEKGLNLYHAFILSQISLAINFF